ncbi:hypothetical protein [Mycoplasma sp. SG1]|uniref:hypothetical protein n=1 Tax=Mycoplasma sp. SG1 TaxID=2810348 RepID=UPI0020248F43|nr:hypothetical protein [Mycoplasma sp. SG1]URM52935.1 hypothetical protein JRW51_01140 [Mycoplasma sp. SG1]
MDYQPRFNKNQPWADFDFNTKTKTEPLVQNLFNSKSKDSMSTLLSKKLLKHCTNNNECVQLNTISNRVDLWNSLKNWESGLFLGSTDLSYSKENNTYSLPMLGGWLQYSWIIPNSDGSSNKEYIVITFPDLVFQTDSSTKWTWGYKKDTYNYGAIYSGVYSS